MLSQLLQYPNCYPHCYPSAIPLISRGSPNKFLVDPIENPPPGHHDATQAVFGLVTIEAPGATDGMPRIHPLNVP